MGRDAPIPGVERPRNEPGESVTHVLAEPDRAPNGQPQMYRCSCTHWTTPERVHRYQIAGDDTSGQGRTGGQSVSLCPSCAHEALGV